MGCKKRAFGASILIVLTISFAACSPGAGDGGVAPLMNPAGVIKGGAFVFKGPPSFRFKIPTGATAVERTHPYAQVVRLEIGDGGTVAASSVAVDDAFKLKQAGRIYLSVMSQVIGEGHDIVANKSIRLGDGSPAYETRIRWYLDPDKAEIRTVLVSAHERGSWVCVAAHYAADGTDLSKIPRTLRFRTR
jgi:hypothetical protein